jgi:1-acyl-sn-glycerol-3-phosphate acyltransferase
MHFLIKQELVRGIGGRILLAAGQVPVARGSGRTALETALELLERERVVGIFPEGTRGAGRVADVQAGVGWLAVHSGAPVIPVACLGTRLTGEPVNTIPKLRRPVVISFAEQVDLAPVRRLGKSREAVSLAIDLVGAALASHVASTEVATGIVLPDA